MYVSNVRVAQVGESELGLLLREPQLSGSGDALLPQGLRVRSAALCSTELY